MNLKKFQTLAVVAFLFTAFIFMANSQWIYRDFVRLDPGYWRIGVTLPQFNTSSPPPSPQISTSTNWTINVSDARTIKVTNISLSATADNIKEFFSFSGEVEYVEMRRKSKTSQVAYVTFKEFHGADTALLLSGASISEASVNITPVEDYVLPPEAYFHRQETTSSPRTPTEAAVRKAEEAVSTTLAKGFVLSKDALKRARSFDERQYQLLSAASARVASLDRRFGLSGKLSAARGAVRGVDERFQVSKLARAAAAAAEQGAASVVAAGSPYASRGATWVSATVGAVARAASDVGAMTMEKVERAKDEDGGGGVEDVAHARVQINAPAHAAREPDGRHDTNKAM